MKEEGKENEIGLFGHRPRSVRQFSNDYWEIIDGMDQMKLSPLFEEILRGGKPTQKQYDERQYNVHVYKVLPYPPGAIKSLFRSRKEAVEQ